jgi:hemoglobin/transferrin/lactoferrin receptor protein
MTVIKFSLAGLFIFFTFIASAQILTIINEDDGKPLDQVTIVDHEKGYFMSTNIKGEADISQFKNSKSIEIRSMGFEIFITNYKELESCQFILSIKTTSYSTSEVVLVANRSFESASKLPVKISSISRKDMALQNPQTAADLLAISGEIFVQKSQQGGGSPMIRGFATNRLLYTVDGVRMNNAIFRSGNIQNVISLDPLSIEHTEIMFGPGSIMYGSDALGAVMSFKTLSPLFAVRDKSIVSAKAFSRFSSANNEKTGHFDFNLGFRKWSFLTSVTYSDYGDLKMGTHGPEEYLRNFYVIRMDSVDRVVSNPNPLVQNPTGYNQINLMQKIRFQPNQQWDFQLAVHYSETSEFSRYDRLIEQQSNGLPRYALWNYGPQKWMMNQLSIRHQSRNKLFDKFNVNIAHQYFEEGRIDRNFSGGNRFRLRNQTEKVNAFSLNVDFEKNIARHKFNYGLESILNDVISKGLANDIRNNNPIAVPDRYPKSTWMSHGAYLNYQFFITEKLTFQSGARFSYFSTNADFSRHLQFYTFDFAKSELSNSAVNASLGLVYQPDLSWKISLNGSTGFRAPNVDDIGKIFDFVSGEVIVPNTNLDAEYIYNGELNMEKLFFKVAKISFTGYYSFLDNAMVRRSFQVNGQDSIVYDGVMSKVYAIQNAAYASVYGFNVGLDVKLPLGLRIMTKYNIQRGSEQMNDGTLSSLRHASPAFGISSISYSNKKITIDLNVIYSEKVAYENLNEEERQKTNIYLKDENGNPYSPSWYTVNLKTMFLITDHLTISAGVENILDKRYRPYSSGLVAAGRNFILSARVIF